MNNRSVNSFRNNADCGSISSWTFTTHMPLKVLQRHDSYWSLISTLVESDHNVVPIMCQSEEWAQFPATVQDGLLLKSHTTPGRSLTSDALELLLNEQGEGTFGLSLGCWHFWVRPKDYKPVLRYNNRCVTVGWIASIQVQANMGGAGYCVVICEAHSPNPSIITAGPVGVVGYSSLIASPINDWAALSYM